MKTPARLVSWLRPTPKSAEDVAAEREAAQLRDEMTTTRWSARAPAGEFYEAGRNRTTNGAPEAKDPTPERHALRVTPG